MPFALDEILNLIHGRLLVSCQAREGEALNDPKILAAIAKSVVDSGSPAIRANRPENIRVMRQNVAVPIFGIYKATYSDSDVYITPTIKEAQEIIEAGCDVLTVDATNRIRPNGQSLSQFFQELLSAVDLPIMTDVSTLAEGKEAANLGADLVATTLAGYTSYSRQQTEPDFALVEELVREVDVPVVAEGRITTPEQARQMLDLGAHAVVVGSMITRPGHITRYFIERMAFSKDMA